MGYVGSKPSAVPLTSADITDGIITSAKITDATIVNGDIANGTIALAKLSATGTADATTFLRGDNTWGSAGASAGQVIQVVSATDSSERSTTSNSFVTGSNTLSVTLTPSSSSNKVLLFAWLGNMANGSGGGYSATIYRGATNLGDATYGLRWKADGNELVNMQYYDSPATTSSTTYQIYFKRASAVGSTILNYNASTKTDSYALTSLIAMEIKG